MHPHPAFAATDAAAMRAFVAARAFAHVFAGTEAGPMVAHVPLIVTEQGALRFHLARANRLFAHLDGASVLASVAGPDGQVYKAKQVVFQVDPLGANRPESAGVSVARVSEDNSAPRRTFDPKHPMADADGYVSMPNVNVVDEMVNMISASRSYQTNVEVMNTAKTLMMKALTLGN